MEDLRKRIQESFNELSKVEKRIAEFLLSNDVNIVNYSVADLSRETEASGASIVRFCRRLGFKGFSELKFQVERDLVSFVGENQRVEPADDLPTVQHKVLSYYSSLIEKMHYALDTDEVKRAVDAIAGASRVHLFAEGGSASIAHYALSILVHSGVYCNIETDASLEVITAAYLKKNDVVIGVSYSGRTINTLDALKIAKEKGATIIVITGNKNSPIKKYADILLTANNNKPMYVSDLPAGRLEEFCIFSVLQVALMLKNNEYASKMSKEVMRVVEGKRIKSK